MQKKIIALAVAGLVSGAAFAQSNVTVYGIADAAYLYSKSGDNKFSGIQSGGWSGSRVGFMGEEGLGNGLKAIFKIEFGTQIDGKTPGFDQTRISYVGVESSAGKFTAGRQYAPSWVYMGPNSSNDLTGNYADNAIVNQVIGGIGGTMATGGDVRWNNSFAYASPNWSGFSTYAIYSFGESANGASKDGASKDGAKFGLSLDYKNGPLNVDLIYQTRLKDAVVSLPADTTSIPGLSIPKTALGGSTDEWYLGGAYDFSAVKVFASYQNTKAKNIGKGMDYEGNTVKRTADIWTLGAWIPVSAAGKVRLAYADSRVKVSGSDTKAKNYGFSAGYTHDLSKRTMLYTSVGYLKNDKGYVLHEGAGSNVGNLDNDGKAHKTTSFMAGMKHVF